MEAKVYVCNLPYDVSNEPHAALGSGRRRLGCRGECLFLLDRLERWMLPKGAGICFPVDRSGCIKRLGILHSRN